MHRCETEGCEFRLCATCWDRLPHRQKQVRKCKALDEEAAQPIEKIRWMWESANGWDVYPPDVSRELELAKRAGKKEHTLRLGDRTLVCRFKEDGGEPVLEVNDEKWRLRVSLSVQSRAMTSGG